MSSDGRDGRDGRDGLPSRRRLREQRESSEQSERPADSPSPEQGGPGRAGSVPPAAAPGTPATPKPATRAVREQPSVMPASQPPPQRPAPPQPGARAASQQPAAPRSAASDPETDARRAPTAGAGEAPANGAQDRAGEARATGVEDRAGGREPRAAGSQALPGPTQPGQAGAPGREPRERVLAAPVLPAAQPEDRGGSARKERSDRPVREWGVDEMIDRDRRRRGARRAIIVSSIIVVILLVLGGAVSFIWSSYGGRIADAMGWVQKDYEGQGQGEVLVTIAEGDTGEDIADTLEQQGVVKTADAFYKLLLAESPEPVFQPGVYQLAQQMSARAALDALMDPASRVEHAVTLPEGLTGEQTLQRLADATGLPLSDFQAAVADPSAYGLPSGAPSMEGWLFPATYTFDPRLTAPEIIAQMVDKTVSVLDAEGVAAADRERILTVASIVQREARQAQDFPKVARVIYNRLDADMLLQMDSTAQYAGSTAGDTVWTSGESLSDDNPWNTYVNPGLPIGPISNPGEQAIEAALSPAPGSWLYFVTVNLDTGETVFNDTLEQHDAAVEQLNQWCLANPGHGC